jgi:Glycosyl transferases group 1
MKIALIYNFSCPHTTGAYIERVLKKAGLAYQVFGVEDPGAIPQGFDLYLRIDHGDYKFDIPAALHPAVFWVVDTHLPKPYKKIRKQVSHYDVVFCAQKEGARRLKRETKVDCQWLPLACEPEIHKRLDLPKQYAIGFVGRNALKFDRGRQLELLRKKYPQSFIGEIDYTKMSGVYSASKIGFNSSIINDINMRVFEIMSSGCFLLTNRIKNNGLEELFREKEHLVTYQNDRQMLSLIDYYLEHAQERERIARAGYELVIKKHTYFSRMQALFNYLAFKFGGDFNLLRV